MGSEVGNDKLVGVRSMHGSRITMTTWGSDGLRAGYFDQDTANWRAEKSKDNRLSLSRNQSRNLDGCLGT